MNFATGLVRRRLFDKGWRTLPDSKLIIQCSTLLLHSLSSTSIRIAGVVLSLNCPDFTAQMKAAKNVSAKAVLKPTSIITISVAIVNSPSVRFCVVLRPILWLM